MADSTDRSTDATGTTDPAAVLDRIASELRTFGASDEDAGRLLNAVEAVLKLADDWNDEAVRLDAVVERSISGGERATRSKAAAQAHKGCADALYETITREITGKENDHG
jgi:hypothetical protein